MLGYPSDIQLFLSEEARFLAAWGPGFQEALLDSCLFPVSRVGLAFHSLHNGRAHRHFPPLTEAPECSEHIPGQGGSQGMEEKGVAQELGQDGPHHSRGRAL